MLFFPQDGGRELFRSAQDNAGRLSGLRGGDRAAPQD